MSKIGLLFSIAFLLYNYSFSQSTAVKTDTTIHLTLAKLNFYEENKVDKADAFLLSGIIPGLGFYKVNREDLLFTYLGANIVFAAVVLNNTDHEKFPYLVLSLIAVRVFEYATLSISIDDYNKGLRLKMEL